jgi:hypothetical protein
LCSLIASLQEETLLYFKGPTEPAPQGEVALQDAFCRPADGGGAPAGYGFAVECKERTWRFVASNEVERTGWMEAIKQTKVAYWRRAATLKGPAAPAAAPAAAASSLTASGQVNKVGGDLEALVQKARGEGSGLQLRPPGEGQRGQAFFGRDLVDFLMAAHRIRRREEAVALGQVRAGAAESHVLFRRSLCCKASCIISASEARSGMRGPVLTFRSCSNSDREVLFCFKSEESMKVRLPLQLLLALCLCSRSPALLSWVLSEAL